MVAPLMACYHVVAGAATNWSKTEGLRLGSLRGARCHPPHNLPRWGICRSGTIRITTPSMLGAVCKCAARMLLSPTTRRRLVSGRCKRESRRTPTHRRTPCPSRGPSRRRLCRPRPCERAGIPKPAKPTMKNHPNQQMAHSTSYCRQKHQVLVQKHRGGTPGSHTRRKPAPDRRRTQLAHANPLGQTTAHMAADSREASISRAATGSRLGTSQALPTALPGAALAGAVTANASF